MQSKFERMPDLEKHAACDAGMGNPIFVDILSNGKGIQKGHVTNLKQIETMLLQIEIVLLHIETMLLHIETLELCSNLQQHGFIFWTKLFQFVSNLFPALSVCRCPYLET